MFQLNLLLSLFLFGFFMNQSDLYTSFGFIGAQPVIIGLILFFQLIYIPYAEVTPLLLPPSLSLLLNLHCLLLTILTLSLGVLLSDGSTGAEV